MRKPPPPPKKIYEYLDKYIIGQEKAKRSLSVAVYNHYKRIYHNIPVQKRDSGSGSSRLEEGQQQQNSNAHPYQGHGMHHQPQPHSPGTLPSHQDLLKIAGMGSALGVGFPPHQPQVSQQQNQSNSGGAPDADKSTANAVGSDILDAKTHDLKLEKSNIMMFGSTG